MTDRKLTCVACKSAITEGDIAHSDLEFGGELKATNQPTYTADADTDLVATIGTLDAYSPMLRTTGNQEGRGIKAIWTPYFYGSIATNASDGKYTDFGKFFNTNSFGAVMISVIGRADYFLGIMQASHDQEAGTLTTGNDGIKSTSNKVTFYAAMLEDGGHLVAKRVTSAGQIFSIQVFGISNVSSSPVVEPKLTYPEIEITDQLLTEIVTI